MSGISSVLHIAKQAILAHQMSLEVAGHNVANVDTPGYSRQTLQLSAAQAYPSAVGPIGSGVQADMVYRHYDQFATNRLIAQTATLNNLTAQSESIRMVEAAFNEAPGLGLNDLLSEFWAAWQGLADNPEDVPARQTVVQQAGLISNQLQSMAAEGVRTRNDIGINLSTAIDNVNSLTTQLAKLNVQITGLESEFQKANDLRDQRDEVLRQLSEYLDVNYFETERGAYTVLLADGHALVEKGQSWQVSWEDNSLQWLTQRRNDLNEFVDVKTTIGYGEELGGKIGGWLEIYNELDPTDPTSYAGKLDAFTKSFIREVNQQHAQGVGLYRFADQLVGTEAAHNTGVLTATMDIATATEDIPAGILRINDRQVGAISGAVSSNGIAAGKAYNAVTAINNAITGVTAKLTTQVAGSPVTAMTGADDGDTVSLSVNGVAVSYTVDVDGTGLDDDDPQVLADRLVAAINSAIAANNADPANGPDLTLEAVRGTGSNGGALNSIMLRNTNAGDESRIVISDLDTTGIGGNLGLANGRYTADASHNTGTVTLFSAEPFSVAAGNDDNYLAQFNLDGGTVSADDSNNDGEFTYNYTDGGVGAALAGYSYADNLVTDGGSFELWIYNTDGTLALPQPVTVNLDRVFTLDDVANAINEAQTTASGAGDPYIRASLDSANRLVLTPDGDHQFAFANDTAHILQVAGINTLLTGDEAGNIAVNGLVEGDVTYLAAATVSDYGELLRGDNGNALAMTDLQRDEHIEFLGSPANSFDGFYNALVGEVGMKGNIINRDQEFNQLLNTQLQEMRDAVSGVSLDEEMANLMKYQYAYSAAAKLISMSDEMLVTLLQTV